MEEKNIALQSLITMEPNDQKKNLFYAPLVPCNHKSPIPDQPISNPKKSNQRTLLFSTSINYSNVLCLLLVDRSLLLIAKFAPKKCRLVQCKARLDEKTKVRSEN